MNWQLIKEMYDRLPKWVQVVTWFAALAAAFYLYISPRFINGQMVILAENGGVIEYRGATIRMHIDGRVLKYTTTEDGFWSVPVVSRLPQAVHLQVFHEDARAWYDIAIASGTVWTNSLGRGDIRLIVENNPPAIKVKVATAGNNAALRFASRVWDGILPAAWARDAETSRPESSKSAVSRKVEAIITAITGKKGQAAGNLKLAGKGGLLYSEKIRIIKETEKEFKLRIPDEELKTMSTSGDLVDYVHGELQKTRR